MMTIFNERAFQIWEYRVSHAQLLIRSPKSDSNETNVDIAFAGVEYLKIPTILKNFSIVVPNKNEVELLNNFRTASYSPKMFVFETKTNRHFIVAAGIKISENTLAVFESSLESF